MDSAFPDRLPWLWLLRATKLFSCYRNWKSLLHKAFCKCSPAPCGSTGSAPSVQSPIALKVQRRQRHYRCPESWPRRQSSVRTEELLTMGLHRHANPLHQVESQQSGFNLESGAEVPQQALLLLRETSFVLWDNKGSEVFPIRCAAPGKDQHPPQVPTHQSSCRVLGPREERQQLLPDSVTGGGLQPPLCKAFPQQKRMGFEAGKGSFGTGKDFRSCYAALLNLLFDPWGKGHFGSWKAIVCLLL